MNIVNGHTIATAVYDRIRARLQEASHVPMLGVILVGDHAPSKLYVQKKREAAEELGIRFQLWEFPEDIAEDALCEQMDAIQRDSSLHGLIVQLPLPSGLNTARVVNHIAPERDVDFLSDAALGTLVSGAHSLVPPTPGAILEILHHHSVEIQGASVAIIGAGRLVGRPLANMLMNAGATVSVLNRNTADIAHFTQSADIVVSATGQTGVLTAEMIGDKAVVIDAGVSVANGVTSGDIDFDAIAQKARLVTPTPGGVGPITVAKLLENTVLSAQL